MNAVISPNSNVVHEAEAQRQYARLKLPAKIRYRTPQGQELEAQLLDLSVGGFGFQPGNTLLSEGQRFHGKLMFEVEGIGFAMDVQFQVRSLVDGKRAGCEFHELRPREIAALRYLISSFLSGELVNVGDLISTLQRDNFTKPRKGKGDDNMSLAARVKALGLSLSIFLVGVAASSYVLYQLYDVYFITHADSAQVSVPGQQVSMPREGTVQSLVKVGDTVAKGAPVGTFSSSALDVLKNVLKPEEMAPDNLQRLFDKSFQGTLTSPCDCRVVAQLVGDGQVAAKGAAVFMMAPVDAVATVEARFPYRAFDELQPGSPVNFLVAGESEPRSGRISTLALQDGGLASDIRVAIQPDQPLATELAKRPVDVRIQPLGGLFDSVAAGK
ncbi:PilZ domain-containing protein [Aquipseudomonas alcaligenes]|uniref:Mannuronan synthase n=1 Tax=Aquipseudomonas alcaligenes TaxID=43263 RepID=A0AA37CD84_AQUAC|nr:PilZ domain-containing protein [Pseudomonas alcaligenes]BCR24756.1 mannuronan synthase [Pseudomonas alcaligenes]GIZ66129.1 mannuronan synthase [Pseudomonas alcaligenes]GIZ70278.1 mannuronan synthase [Pseudomonas alcaligenes]GIZ74631.1 mannuronan synthase [Pseudomonas alcaligenes]GIZ79143.1 mannuronan synthase [Pseudomonas alcaligenes]